MNSNTPQMTKHATGQYFSKWAGKFHYYGADFSTAQRKYLDDLKRWSEWKGEQSKRRAVAPRTDLTVADAVERFLDFKEQEGGIGRRRHYESHLRRFNNALRNQRIDSIRPAHLHALKEDMLRTKNYKPKTINHDLSSIKSLLLWCMSVEMIPPVNLRLVKGMALPPVADKAMTKKEVRHFVMEAPDPIKAWLAVQYLTLMRPSEVVKVVNGQGEWEQPADRRDKRPWLFRLHRGKTDVRSQEFRRIVFSERALFWLDRCEAHWTRGDTYYQAVSRACGPGGPHPLRHTGATHLSRLGVAVSEIDLLLGHLPTRVTRTYIRINWPTLRQTVSRLNL